ncbi:hypothetical protein CRUP_008888 [Coryphaenoides rupestris]|nr:hypothetical protein CRUP_008888 [Coryphaenoides rupestris]
MEEEQEQEVLVVMELVVVVVVVAVVATLQSRLHLQLSEEQVHVITFSVARLQDRSPGQEVRRGPVGAVQAEAGVCAYRQPASCCPGWRNVSGGGGGGGGGGGACQHVNECGFPERVCSQRCMNTHGSYRCYCEPGYALAADGHTCTDKDECVTGANGCSRHASCVNTDGSYACRCGEGYVGDGRTCRPLQAPAPTPQRDQRHGSRASLYYRYKLRKRTKPLLEPPPPDPVG